MIRDVPVDPDDEQARRWLEEELGRGDEQYQPPEPPGWWQDFLDWIDRLLSGIGGSEAPAPGIETGQTVGVVIAVILVVAILVVAFAIFGLPRLRKRSTVTGDLFGEDDDRSALQLRTAAQQAADAGDFTSAVVELFRSLARDLAERGIVLTFPGTTARDFARRTGLVFPPAADRLAESAVVFDDLRYLGGVGTREQWLRMSALDAELRAARRPRVRAADVLGANATAEAAESAR
ncbi:DUF4129 domain-containing protein [Pseudolysinimonas sp.]|uniref:DUF4129 domain-containing protein n=1 Tax=Pseudolysinimonas sp. TaxID=2680009 RepID=UPI00286BB3DD|nr:DUF4129 domain-containing protein [Pseudolysinimonas sp.]